MLARMSAPVYKRVRLNDEYNAQKAAVKTISYEHCESINIRFLRLLN